jgi:hypothetical protein
VIDGLLEMIWANLRILVPLAGFIGVLVGVALVHRSTRREEDAVGAWRYRDLVDDPSLLHPRLEEGRFVPRSGSARDDLAAARRMARALLIVAIAMPFAVLILSVMQPGGSTPMLYEPPWYEAAVLGAGAAGYLLGLAWMIRIYRADPEPGERTWRYRS